ncbi:MAG TPA: complex I NDUFA9 subunit family protein [Candidatus Tenderia electrophaga]|uniref:Complex I NDUFA9 subunit family protein n=1 Tax=Candidatus Tenderia electrophaga TaxID=1748243 RepID=A0A832J8U8_9GAMM|nr:complex I NDUFA9 subunit family protein [Candidatus Tenderia electrophaga]
MTAKTICVLGGTGFVGHQLISQLTRAGYYVIAPSRNRERHRSLQVLPKVDVIDADIHDEETLNALFVGCHAVINLTAILNENKRGEFKRVHVELVEKVINACKNAGVTRLLQMTAINADATKGSSQYLRSKGEGEALALAADDLNVTVFRPSVIFGKDDSFFNKFAELLLNLPILPLACPGSRMAPIHVGDVAAVMVKALNDKTTFGQRYDLCGPKSYTLEELVNYTNQLTGKKRTIIPLGDGMSAMLGRIMGMMPFKPFSYDNYLSLQTPAVSDKPFPSQFGITPITVENIVPKYIGAANMRGRYDDIRQKAARDKNQPA